MKIAYLTVVYNNYEILNKNLNLVNLLNKNTDISYYIVDNSDFNKKSKINFNKKFYYCVNRKYPKNNFKKNSFHHAFALDYGLRKILKSKIKYDFLIVLDPDYFCLEKNWILNLCSYMNRDSINILGSPWSKKWNNKYRNFPCIQFSIYSEIIYKKIQTFAPCNYKGIKGKIDYNINRIIYNKYLYHLFFKFFLNHVIDTGSSIFYYFNNIKTYVFEETLYEKMNPLSLKILKENNISFKNYDSSSAEVFKFYDMNTLHFRYFGNLNN